jgi:hypothetical protein
MEYYLNEEFSADRYSPRWTRPSKSGQAARPRADGAIIAMIPYRRPIRMRSATLTATGDGKPERGLDPKKRLAGSCGEFISG